MSVDVKYRTTATAHGGRDGESHTDDGALAVKLGVPKEMGGNGDGNNPEQLFAVGYAACFLGAMKFVVSQDKSFPKIPDDATVQSQVGIGSRSEGGFGIDVELTVTLPGVDHETAEKLVQKTHDVCPYSNAIKASVPVRLKVA